MAHPLTSGPSQAPHWEPLPNRNARVLIQGCSEVKLSLLAPLVVSPGLPRRGRGLQLPLTSRCSPLSSKPEGKKPTGILYCPKGIWYQQPSSSTSLLTVAGSTDLASAFVLCPQVYFHKRLQSCPQTLDHKQPSSLGQLSPAPCTPGLPPPAPQGPPE